MPSNHLILCRPLLLPPSIFPSIRIFSMSQFFTSGGQSIGVSASASVLPMNIQDWFPLGWTGWISLQSKGLSRISCSITVQKHQFFSTQLSFIQTCSCLKMKLWNSPAHQPYPREIPFHSWGKSWIAFSSILLYFISSSKCLPDFKMCSAHASPILIQTYLTNTCPVSPSNLPPPIHSLTNPSHPLLPDRSSLLPISLVSSITCPSGFPSSWFRSAYSLCHKPLHSFPPPYLTDDFPSNSQVCSGVSSQSKTPPICKSHLKFLLISPLRLTQQIPLKQFSLSFFSHIALCDRVLSSNHIESNFMVEVLRLGQSYN